MKKVSKIKRIFLCLFSALFIGCGTAAVGTVIQTQKANADVSFVEPDDPETDTTFDVLGMSVRIQKPEGLRFIAQISKEERDTYKAYGDARYGMLVIPEAMLGENEYMEVEPVVTDGVLSDLTLSNPRILRIQTKHWLEEETANDYGIETGTYDAFASVVANIDAETGKYLDMPESYYNLPMLARAYVAYKDANGAYQVAYSDQQITRSLGYASFVARGADNYIDVIDPMFHRVGSTSEVVNTNPIANAQSLRLTTSAAGQEVNFCSMFGVKFFPTAGKKYYSEIKLRVDSITNASIPRIALRLQDETDENNVVVTEGLHLYLTQDGAVDFDHLEDGATSGGIVGTQFAPTDSGTTFSYNAETKVITMKVYFTAATDNQILSLTTVGGNTDGNGAAAGGSSWMVTIDDFFIQEAGKMTKLVESDFEGLTVGAAIQDSYMSLVERAGVQKIDGIANTEHGKLTGSLIVNNHTCNCGFDTCAFGSLDPNGSGEKAVYTPTFKIAGVDAFTSPYVDVIYGVEGSDALKTLVYYTSTDREVFRLDATADLMTAAGLEANDYVTLKAWALVGREDTNDDGVLDENDTDLWWSEYSTSTEIFVVTTTAEYTPANVMQASTGGGVTLAFNAGGRPFRLYDEDGNVVLTVEEGATASNENASYTFNGETASITLKNDYLNTLRAGLNHVTAKVCDAAHSEVRMGFTVYGDYSVKQIMESSNNSYISTDFDWLDNKTNNYSALSNVAAFRNASETQVSVTNLRVVDEAAGAISGKSLELSSTVSNSSKEWQNLLGFNYNFRGGVTYEMEMKFKWTTSSSGALCWVFDNNATTIGGWGVNLGAASVAHAGWGSAMSTFAYDRTTGVVSVRAFLNCGADSQWLKMQIANGDGTWTIIIDDLCIKEHSYFDLGGGYFNEFEHYTVGSAFTKDGGNLFTAASTASVVSSNMGGQSLQVTTSTVPVNNMKNAGINAEWNRMLASRKTTDEAGFGFEAGRRYLVHVKMKYQVPAHFGNDTTGIIAIRFLEEEDDKEISKVNGLLISVTRNGNSLNYKDERETFYTYDPYTGILSAYVYMTATSANQQLNITTVSNRNVMVDTNGDGVQDYGQWTLTIDDFSIVTVSHAAYMNFNANNAILGERKANDPDTSSTITVFGYTVDNMAQHAFTGQSVSFPASIQDGGIYHSDTIDSNFWSVAGTATDEASGGNNILMWINGLKYKLDGENPTNYRISLKFIADEEMIYKLFFHRANGGVHDGAWIINSTAYTPATGYIINTILKKTPYNADNTTVKYIYEWSFVVAGNDDNPNWVIWDRSVYNDAASLPYAPEGLATPRSSQKFGFIDIRVVPIT